MSLIFSEKSEVVAHIEKTSCQSTREVVNGLIILNIRFSDDLFKMLVNSIDLSELSSLYVADTNLNDKDLCFLLKWINPQKFNFFGVFESPITSKTIKCLFKRSPRITSISFNYTSVCDFGMHIILNYYKNHPELKLNILGFDNTEVSVRAVERLVQNYDMLNISNVSLQERTYTTYIGTNYLFPSLARKVGNITRLCLNDCILNDESINSLAMALPTCKLISIGLINNNLQDHHVQKLSENLSGNCPVAYFDVSRNSNLTVLSVLSIMFSVIKHNQLRECVFSYAAITTRSTNALNQLLRQYHNPAVSTILQILGPHANSCIVNSLPIELLKILFQMLPF